MGTIQHKPMIVSIHYNEKQAKRVHKKCIKLFGEEMVTSMIFGCNFSIFFMVGPTGSKLGWDLATEFEDSIEEFRRWLAREYIDEALHYDLVFPSWGEFDASIEIEGSL